MVYTLYVLVLVLVAGCSASDPDVPPARPAEGLALGVAFPPSASAADRAWTVACVRALCAPRVRFGQQWALREPNRDEFAWGPLDRRLKAFAGAGVEVFLTLEIKGLPDWFAALPPPEREAEFREYARALLERSGARLAAIQLGNEWNWEIDRYLGGDVAGFVRLATILSEEVARLPPPERPEVVLGSVSIGGLRGLALAQGRIENVVFDGVPLYSDAEVRAAKAASPAALARFRAVVGAVPFSAVDLHLYDDPWNWPTYRAAVEQLLTDVGKDPAGVSFVASEFGGPHPTLEPGDESFAAGRVREYVRALGETGIAQAYFFKLVEVPGADIEHPNSFLVTADGRETLAFGALAETSCR